MRSEKNGTDSTQKAGSKENDWNDAECEIDAPAAEAGMSTCTTPSLDLLGSAAEPPRPVKSRMAASRLEDLIVNQQPQLQSHQPTGVKSRVGHPQKLSP